MAEKVKNATAVQLPLAHVALPGRNFLMISEVARAFSCTEQHIRDLIDEDES